MTLRIVGAGACRTGTTSLKLALERLLGAPCYHMAELFRHPEHLPHWQLLADGGTPDWDELLGGYAAAVDFPTAFVWRELARRDPDAPVLLSTRPDAQTWWRSTEATVVAAERARRESGEHGPMRRMIGRLSTRFFCSDWEDEAAMTAAYTAHNDAVRAEIPAGRLVEWQPGDGWEPLCRALDVPVPDGDFPHTNSTDEFRARVGLS